MAEHDDLLQFAEDVRQDVISLAEGHEEESFRTERFVQLFLDHLSEAGELEDAELCHHQSTRLEVHAYSLSSSGDELDLVACLHSQRVPPESVTKQEVTTKLRRLVRFFEEARNGLHRSIEEASGAFDLAEQIHENRSRITQVRLFFITDGLVTREGADQEISIDGVECTVRIWDLLRLFRCVSSARRREPIRINFLDEFGQLVPCLEAPSTSKDCKVYFAAFPGRMLADIYQKYGTRMLERNVRAFLQVRGKVNKGIRDTILNEPARFLAYNNGIAATAAKVELGKQQDGSHGICSLDDLQIVNGGQTTASIHHAAYRDKADVSQVVVPVKLSVVDDAVYSDVVPLISRFANTQNRVNEADFQSNDPFHIRLEELSRTVWAPAAAGYQRQTRWFFERARGQYNDDRAREPTPARKRQFTETFPVQQRFSKTDLAKFENTWHQLPHIVSRGAEKNFKEFTSRIASTSSAPIDARTFQQIVARAILFKNTEKIVQALRFGGYRANIVTYSLSYLFHRTAGRIDLDLIWRLQGIDDQLKEAITRISKEVHRSITNPPGGRNVTEWCKKEDCWAAIRSLEIELGDDLEEVLLPESAEGSASPALLSSADIENISKVKSVSAVDWKRLASWAKQSGHLQGWQRRIAFSIGQRLAESRDPSAKQAAQGVKILVEATRLGFKIESDRA